MIVDAHTHLWQSPDQLGPQISSQLRQRFGGPGEPLDASPSAHEEATAVVDAALVLGFRSVHLQGHVPAKLLAAYIASRSSRMFGLAGVDPMEDGALDQVQQLPSMKLSGIVISPSEGGYHPCHSRSMQLLERCQAMGLLVYVHQGTYYTRDSRLEHAAPFLLDEVARSFPRLKLVVSHCGYPWIDHTLVLVGKHRNVWTDLADAVSRPWQLYNVILQASELGVIDRLLLGSDFPHRTPQEAIEAIYGVNQFALQSGLPAIPREKLRSIIERDTLGSLGLKPPAGVAGPAALRPMPTRLSTGDRS